MLKNMWREICNRHILGHYFTGSFTLQKHDQYLLKGVRSETQSRQRVAALYRAI